MLKKAIGLTLVLTGLIFINAQSECINPCECEKKEINTIENNNYDAEIINNLFAIRLIAISILIEDNCRHCQHAQNISELIDKIFVKLLGKDCFEILSD